MPAMPPPAARCAPPPPNQGPAPVRRLTYTEYRNTVKDLFGAVAISASAMAPVDSDPSFGGSFSNRADALGITPLGAEGYAEAAANLSAGAVTQLPKLLPCDPAKVGEAACAEQFVNLFGKRAYRRPLRGEEAAALLTLFRSVQQVSSFGRGIQAVVKVMLQSPHFLYRDLPGPGGVAEEGRVRLGSHELASRLSYLFWRTMPDAELFAAADTGRLATPEQIDKQARRLLASARAKDTLSSLYDEWLGVGEVTKAEKDPKVFKLWTPNTGGFMRGETDLFIRHVLWDKDGRLETLLTAPVGFVTGEIAKVYALATPVVGTKVGGYTRVELDPAQRSGILSQPSLLAVNALNAGTDPIRRGKFVRKQLLCEELPAPPPDLEVAPPMPRPGTTTRQRLEEHRASPACAACHRLLDPVGFIFENLDGVGQWRTVDDGLPIDSHGELWGTRDADGKYDSVAELGKKLAGSRQIAGCVARQHFRFAFGRADGAEDAAAIAQAVGVFERAGGDLRELFVALTQTDAFLYRPARREGATP